jgi:hypothetical protein
MAELSMFFKRNGPKSLGTQKYTTWQNIGSVAFMQQTCGIFAKRPAKSLTEQVPYHKTYSVGRCDFYVLQGLNKFFTTPIFLREGF